MEPENVFYSNLCHFCKIINENLKRCASCKTVAYCSQEHQVANWPSHKELCKVIVKTRHATDYSTIKSYEEFKKLRISRSVTWQRELKRSLKPYEAQMWMFPKVCAVCYNDNTVINCSKCLNVSYCCEDHKERHFDTHDKYCGALRLAMLIDVHFFNGGKENSIILKGIDTDLVLQEDKTSFLNTVCHRSISWRDDAQYVIDTDQLLSGGTLLLTLEKARMLDKKRILDKNSLEIHFVGASNFELCLNWFCILELLFHYIKNLREITITLIGPELNDDENIDFMQFKEAFCEKCQGVVNKMDFKAIRGLYHEQIENLTKPDLVVGFNSGLHEFAGDTTNDLWKESIHSLISDPKVPLLLTAYTEDEITQDISRLEEVEEVEILYGLKENPFKNQRPFRNWTSFDVPVFYNNAFVAVVARRKHN